MQLKVSQSNLFWDFMLCSEVNGPAGICVNCGHTPDEKISTKRNCSTNSSIIMTRTVHFQRSGFLKLTFFSKYFITINFPCTRHKCACTRCIWECQSPEEKDKHVRLLTTLRISETFYSRDKHTHWMLSSLRKYPKETPILHIIYFKSCTITLWICKWILCRHCPSCCSEYNKRPMQNGDGRFRITASR